jgi:hypothetical protein
MQRLLNLILIILFASCSSSVKRSDVAGAHSSAPNEPSTVRDTTNSNQEIGMPSGEKESKTSASDKDQNAEELQRRIESFARDLCKDKSEHCFSTVTQLAQNYVRAKSEVKAWIQDHAELSDDSRKHPA